MALIQPEYETESPLAKLLKLGTTVASLSTGGLPAAGALMSLSGSPYGEQFQSLTGLYGLFNSLGGGGQIDPYAAQGRSMRSQGQRM